MIIKATIMLMLLAPVKLARYELRELMVAAMYLHGDYYGAALVAEELE
jgi:hypothetical protein